MTIIITDRDIVLQRLHNQCMRQPIFAKPAEVVRWFGAMQAQEYLHSLWKVLRRNQSIWRKAGLDQNDKSYWFAAWQSSAQATVEEAYLLPSYDEYTVAYQDRSSLFDRSAGERIEGKQPESVLGPVIVIGGRVVGTWQRTLKQDNVSVKTNLTRSISATEQEFIATARQRFANFVGVPTSR